MIALTLGSSLVLQIEDDGKGYNFEESKNKRKLWACSILCPEWKVQWVGL